MAPRAIWKGHLEIGQLVCPVALHAAASTSERVAFHIVNRTTGHRVRRVFVDAETGEAGRARRPGQGLRDRPRQDDRGRGRGARRGGPRERQDAPRRGLHPLRRGRHALLRPALLPDAGRRGGRDRLRGDPRRAREAEGRGDRPHRPLPPPAPGADPRAGRRHGRQHAGVRPRGPRRRQGLPRHPRAEDRQGDARPRRHIIRTKRGKFQPERFEDRYDDALAELVKAKAEGKAIPGAEGARGRQAHRPDGGAAQERRRQGQGEAEGRRRSAPAPRRKAG